MSKENAFLTIGELGQRVGLASSALRYYERAGLLTPDGRARGRRRPREHGGSLLRNGTLGLIAPNRY